MIAIGRASPAARRCLAPQAAREKSDAGRGDDDFGGTHQPPSSLLVEDEGLVRPDLKGGLVIG